MSRAGRTQSPQGTQRMVVAAVSAISAFIFVTGCGKKGPPLAPLVKLPVPPADLTAARRGDTVDLSFTVPAVNTDGSRPANVASTEVYAITAPVTGPPLPDATLLKFGTKIGTVDVKAPRDPNLTTDADDPSDEVDPPEGTGLDQGAVARVQEPLTPEMVRPVNVTVGRKQSGAAAAARSNGPLLGPPEVVPVRTYVAFGTSTRGRKGPLSKRVTVPLVPPPPPPSHVAMTYDESAVTLTWARAGGSTESAPEGVLPSRVIGVTRPAITYNVYDASVPDAAVRLTDKPIDAATYVDKHVTFGENRCYAVVAVETIDGGTIESDAPPPECKTLVDTFPPAAPKGLKAIPSEGAISLIWEPNTEKDLAGYIILRGVEPAGTLQQITAAPIVEASFRDDVKPGIAYVYAVRAVDNAGNGSEASARVVETAR